MRKPWSYQTRVYKGNKGDPFVVFESPVFEYYGSTGEWWSHCVAFGNRYFLRLSFDIAKRERFCIRLEALKLLDLEFNVWWPGA